MLFRSKQGFDNVDQLQKQLKGFPPDKRTNLILKTLGMEDVKKAENALNAIIGQSGKKVSLEADTSKVTTAIKSLENKSAELNLDASKSISNIKSKLKENIDLAISSGEGTKHLSSINGLMGELKNIMNTLSNKLPQPALV